LLNLVYLNSYYGGNNVVYYLLSDKINAQKNLSSFEHLFESDR